MTTEPRTEPLAHGQDLGDMPTERLEHEMLTLAGHLAAATCSFLMMVGEYDDRRSWESWECLSCAHWLNWRCGVGMTAAREQVRVARALRILPLVRRTFAEGQISYSKVRAITRVAHPSIEAKLVDLARWSTASQLERACSALRRCADADEEEQRLCEDEERAALRRSLRWHAEPETGDLVVRLRIPAGESAESFSAAVDGATDRFGTSADPGEPEHEALECRRLDALLDLVAAGTTVDDSLAAQPEVVVHVTTGAVEPRSAPRWPIATQAGQPLSERTLGRLSCDAGLRSLLDVSARHAELVTSLDLGRHRRFPGPALRRAVQRRDGGCCRFPGCDRRHRLHVHHIVWWERGGRTDRENLLLLCPKHHRAVHHGGWVLTGTAAHPAFDRDGQRVPPSAPPLQGRLAELVDAHRRYGLDIAADGAGSHWQGDHIDWDCFFTAFLPWDDGDAPTPDDPAEGPGPPCC